MLHAFILPDKYYSMLHIQKSVYKNLMGVIIVVQNRYKFSNQY